MKRSDLIFILVASIILAMIWSIFTILHRLNTSTISESVTTQIAPIPGTFDTKTIDNLKKNIQVTPANVLVPAVSPSPIPKATPTPPLIITLTTTPSASSSTGGTLQ